MADERSARVEFTGAARAAGGTGRRARLRGVWGNPSGFESRVAHHSWSFPPFGHKWSDPPDWISPFVPTWSVVNFQHERGLRRTQGRAGSPGFRMFKSERRQPA